MTTFYDVGKIVNTHGVRGEVRVITISHFAEERYKPGNTLYFFEDEQSENAVPLTIASHRPHKQFDLLRFDHHPGINDVEKYKGGLLKVKGSDRSQLAEDEYYYDQIIGCKVVTDSGEELGTVKEILAPGANDVWVVQANHRKQDILIPYIEDVVQDVNIDDKKIIIHVLEGLIE